MLLLLFSGGGPFSGVPSAARTITVRADGSISPKTPFVKDPNAVLDYSVDWSLWLGSDVIDSSTTILPTGLTSPHESGTTTRSTIWLAGGTVRRNYDVVNRIVTVGGRTNDQTIRIKIEQC